MRVAVRPPQGRSITLLAVLALAPALVAPAAVLGAGGNSANPVPEPREMLRGEPSGYRLPFAAGLDVRIEQGWNTGYSHFGRSSYAYDFGLHLGTPVLAAASGVVTYTHSGETRCGGAALRNSANLVTIDHPDGSATQYGHLGTVDVEVGDVVEAGQVIGTSGNSGFTGCMPHLHFARQLQGGPVTRSLPIYFAGFEDRQFVSGEVIQASPRCTYLLAEATASDSATNTFCGAYYAGEFEGPALFTRADPVLDVRGEKGGPGGYWLDGAKSYSARWSGRFDFAPWWYTFRVEASGGVRVRLDGLVIVEDWVDDEQPRVFEVRRRMSGGVHVIEVEHFTARQADRIDVDWSPLLIDR